MFFKKFIKSIFKIRKWPFYFTILYIKFIKINIWKSKNIKLKSNISFLGIPIIQNFINARITIGKNCLLCSDSKYTALGVSHKIIIRTLNQNAEIIIGDNVRMSGTCICAAKSIIIGNRCVIGSDVIIADTNFHSLESTVRSTINDPIEAKNAPIKIGNDVFIGTKSIILSGVSLGDRVIVGAGSVVTKSFSEDLIIAGNPAKIIRNIK